MKPFRSSGAPWRAFVLLVVVAAGMPAARAATVAGLLKKPYVVLVDNPGVAARTVADDHHRRFGVTVGALFDRLGGYAGSMTDKAARQLAKEPGVTVARDTVVTGFADEVDTRDVKAIPPPYSLLPANWGWGLDRIDQRAALGSSPEGRYRYVATGEGVTAYVIDTGIRTTHEQFGGRASVGFDALGGNGEDCNGHGTHVAGILGGRSFGVAPDVKLKAVRVLNCNASGTASNVVAGINFVANEFKRLNPPGATEFHPVVANMSLGGATNSALDKAVQNAVKTGVVFTVAAGNGGLFGGKDACSVSPARVPEVITVGATDSKDKRPTWSNYGRCVDVFAPGEGIVSAWYKSPTAAKPPQTQTQADDTAWSQISGTSMSSPAVAGVAALMLEQVPRATPAQVSAAIAGVATRNAVTGSNVSGARLLFTPTADDDVETATDLLTTGLPVPAPAPAPAPPRLCLLCGLLG